VRIFSSTRAWFWNFFLLRMIFKANIDCFL
jgi:hypothetical protein